MNGVAAEEEEVNEPGSDTATGAGDADQLGVVGGRHVCGEEEIWVCNGEMDLAFTSSLFLSC